MKGIYIILTYTGTIPSKVIKSFTKDEFSHVSIALDVDLQEMYSFARLRKYNFFIAGFLHEKINEGTFKRFKKTTAKIYHLEITDEQYNKIKDKIEEINENKEQYKFNILGLCAVSIHMKIKRERYFYCAEFVKYLLEEAGIKTNLPEIVKPEDFKELEGLEEIYSGLLREYQSSKTKLRTLIKDNLELCIKKHSMT